MVDSRRPLRWSLWAALAFDWLVWLPVVFDPEGTAARLGQRAPLDPVWAAFSAQLVLLVSLFLVPAALDPSRYRALVQLAALTRFPAAAFFLLLRPGDYPAIGIAFLVIGAVQLALLLRDGGLEVGAGLSLGLGHGPVSGPGPGHGSRSRPPIRDGAPAGPASAAATWFRRLVWLGIAQNVVLGLPGVFVPETVLSVAGQRPTSDPIWAAFASLTLIALSLMYLPGARNPRGLRAAAILSVAARAFGVLFFFVLYPGLYPLFGLLDLVAGGLQAPVLYRALQRG